jgi:EF hand
MKSWLWLAIAFAITLGLTGAAMTQPPGKGKGPKDGFPPGKGPKLEKIVDDLNLTDEQLEKAREALKVHDQRMRKLIDEAHRDLLREMKTFLTAEQYATFKDELDRAPGGLPGGPKGGPKGGAPKGVPADELVEHIMSFDKNKDGKVTKDELPERLQYLIELGDLNGDGALDADELRRLAERLQKEVPGGPGGKKKGPPKGDL